MLKITFNRYLNEGATGSSPAGGATGGQGGQGAANGAGSAGNGASGGGQAAPKFSAGQYARQRYTPQQAPAPLSREKLYEGITGPLTAEHHQMLNERQAAWQSQYDNVSNINKQIEQLYALADGGYKDGDGTVYHFDDQGSFDKFIEIARSPMTLERAAQLAFAERARAAAIEKATASIGNNKNRVESQARIDATQKVPRSGEAPVGDKPQGQTIKDIFASLGGDPSNPFQQK